VNLKPIPQPGKLIMQFEWFYIYEYDGHRLWLAMKDGEGMAFPKSKLMGFLAGIWKEF
jgi:hypothetical protein